MGDNESEPPLTIGYRNPADDPSRGSALFGYAFLGAIFAGILFGVTFLAWMVAVFDTRSEHPFPVVYASLLTVCSVYLTICRSKAMQERTQSRAFGIGIFIGIGIGLLCGGLCVAGMN